jgi:hypothetical protein
MKKKSNLYTVLVLGLMDYLRRHPNAAGEPVPEDLAHPRGLPVPTKAKPATEAKVRVFEERYRRRQALFHPADARWGPEEGPAWRRGANNKMMRVLE